MKKYFTCICTLAALCGLTAAAYADMIPMTTRGTDPEIWLPVVLVVVVINAAALLIKRFFRRK